MRLPTAPDKYAKSDQDSTRRAITEADADNVKKNSEVEMLRYILTSPNGTRYKITVDNSGVVGTTAV